MSVTRLAGRYAKSLFELATEQNLLDQVQEDLTYVQSVAKLDDFNAFLRNPVIGADRKEQVFKAVFSSKVQDITLRTLCIVAEHKRESFLNHICHSFTQLYNRAKGISKVTLITAVSVSDATVRDILEGFRSKGLIDVQVDLEQEIDPEIIGGFVLRAGDQVYNASIGYQIDALRKKFNENLYIKNL